jgi:uncharacterized RDD family membrane protein YckC
MQPPQMEPAPPPPVQPGRVAGFWVRVLSDLIDTIVLGIFGLLLALPFGGVFERLGEHGVFVGLAVSLAYSGVLQSRIGRGQTLGKRLLRLRVTKLDGSFLSVDRAVVRYVLASFPAYNGAIAYALHAALPVLPLEWIVSVASGLGVAFFLGCFLVIPLHPLKRGLHDLVTGSIVTRDGPLDPAFIAPRNDPRRDRRVVTAGLVVAALASVAGLALSSAVRFAAHPQATLRAAQELGIENLSVIDMSEIHFGDRAAPRALVVTGFLPRPSGAPAPDWDGAAKRLEGALHEDYPDVSIDAALITLRTGYNIGIARSYEQQARNFDWRTRRMRDVSDLVKGLP